MFHYCLVKEASSLQGGDTIQALLLIVLHCSPSSVDRIFLCFSSNELNKFNLWSISSGKKRGRNGLASYLPPWALGPSAMKAGTVLSEGSFL